MIFVFQLASASILSRNFVSQLFRARHEYVQK